MTRILPLFVLASVLIAPAVASAGCADDVKELKARLERVEKQDRAKAASLRRELQPMDSPLRPGESECRNIVVRAWRILKATPVPTCPPPAGAAYTLIQECQQLQKKRQ
jgi:hypothetical protein